MKNVGRQSSDESAALILFGRNRFEYISRVTWIPSPTGGTWLNISRLKAFARIDFGGMQCIDSSKFGALKIRSEWYVMIGRPPVVSANEWAAGGRRSVNSKAASGRKWESGLVSFSPSWCNPRVWPARKSKKFLDEGNKKRGATRDAPRAVASCWLLFFFHCKRPQTYPQGYWQAASSHLFSNCSILLFMRTGNFYLETPRCHCLDASEAPLSARLFAKVEQAAAAASRSFVIIFQFPM